MPMLRFVLPLLIPMTLLCGAAPAQAAAMPPPVPQATWDPHSTWALVAGVLRWEDPALDPFEAHHRKDIELMNALAERGVPAAQRVLLIDRQATRTSVLAALDRLVAAAPPGSTFIVYFEGHGLYDDERRYHLATSDTHTEHLATTGLEVAALLPILATRGARDRVLLLADACYSGNLAALALALSYVGVPTVALTSASEVSASSENWTFTQALVDGLAGRAIVDVDSDGRVLLSEIAAEARTAMRYREGQPIGWAPVGFDDMIMAPTASWTVREAALAPRGEVFARGDWVVARRLDGARGIARVIGAAKNPETGAVRLRLEYYDYADRAFGWAHEAATDPVMFYVYPVGTRLRVRDDDVVYAAHVERLEDELHFVVFDDWAPGADHAPDDALPDPQFVTQDQILGHLDPSEEAKLRVLVEDRGDLYEALVKGHFQGQVCVRYPGSPLVEDECVPAARVTRDTRR